MSRPTVRTNFENSKQYTSDELLDYLMKELGVTNNNGSPIVGTKRWEQIQRNKERQSAMAKATATASSAAPAAVAVVSAPDVFSTTVGPPNSSATPTASSAPSAPSALSATVALNQPVRAASAPSVATVAPVAPVQGIAIGTRRRPIPMISFRGGGEIPAAAIVTVQTDPYSVPTMMNYSSFQDMKNSLNSRVGGSRISKKSKRTKTKKTRKTRKTNRKH